MVADGQGRRLLARAADVAAQSRPSPKTRQDYAGIYTRLIRWLANGLGRAPYREDLTLEVLLAWRNHRECSGGHGGQGLAPAALRVEVAAVRVLLRQLGMDDVATELTTEGHRPAPPDTITPEDYDRLLRMPDRRTRLGVRDHAVLRILGDTGLRSAELRGLCVRHLERAPVEANPSLYLSLYADGHWQISGVGDEAAQVLCAEGHEQNDRRLERSMAAFLEQEFPGGTWEGSDPVNGATTTRYRVRIAFDDLELVTDVGAFNLEQAVCLVVRQGIREMTFNPAERPITISVSGGVPEPLDVDP